MKLGKFIKSFIFKIIDRMIYTGPHDFEPVYKKTSSTELFREQQRQVFAVTIIATVLAAKSYGLFEIKFFGEMFRTILSSSALLAFMYLLLTAAALKYSDPHWLYQHLYLSHKLRKLFYDTSVHIFANYFITYSLIHISEQIGEIFKISFLIIFTPLLLVALYLIQKITAWSIKQDLDSGEIKLKRANL